MNNFNILQRIGKGFACLLIAIFGFGQMSVKAAPVNIIFDNDMGNDVDDIIALDLLLKYHEAGKANILAILGNRQAESCISYCDAYCTWFGYPNIPLGIVVNGSNPTPEEKSYATKTLALEENGKPIFRRTHKDPRALPNAVDLYRKILSSAANKSVVIVSTGFSSNIARLMETEADEYSPLSGKELLKRKVSWISVMAGNYEDQNYAEYNVWNDVKAAKKFFEETPVPIAFCDFALGKTVHYPSTSVAGDFGWCKHHPFVTAYNFYHAAPYESPTWDPMAMLYALEPTAGFFGLSERGFIKVEGKGMTKFTPSEQGNCRFLTATDEQKQRIRDYFVKIVSKKPRHCKTW